MHTVQSILNEIKAGDIRPLYFLMGEEAFFIDQISTFIETRPYSSRTISQGRPSFSAIFSSSSAV